MLQLGSYCACAEVLKPCACSQSALKIIIHLIAFVIIVTARDVTSITKAQPMPGQSSQDSSQSGNTSWRVRIPSIWLVSCLPFGFAEAHLWLVKSRLLLARWETVITHATRDVSCTVYQSASREAFNIRFTVLHLEWIEIWPNDCYPSIDI